MLHICMCRRAPALPLAGAQVLAEVQVEAQAEFQAQELGMLQRAAQAPRLGPGEPGQEEQEEQEQEWRVMEQGVQGQARWSVEGWGQRELVMEAEWAGLGLEKVEGKAGALAE